MIAQDEFESTWESINYGRFINQFRLDIVTSIRQLDRIKRKICTKKTSILFNQMCLNEEMIPNNIFINRELNIDDIAYIRVRVD